MVTFRFYVVSTVAFFLALAVGVVVGSVLDGRIADSLQDRLEGVEQSLDETVAAIDARKAELERDQLYIEASAPFAVQDRLPGTATLVVAENGIDAAPVEDLVRRLREGGSRVEGIVWLDRRWSLDDAGDLAVAAEIAGASNTASPAQVRAALWDEVFGVDPETGASAFTGEGATGTDGTESGAAATTTTTSAVAGATSTTTVTTAAPDEATQVPLLFSRSPLNSLAEAGLLRLQTIDGDVDVPAERLVVAGATGVDSTLDDPGSGVSEAVTGAALVSLPAAVGEVVPPPQDETDLDPPRGELVVPMIDSDATGISTVDDLDLVAGRVAMVLALAEGLEGLTGRYGYGPDVDGVLPPWQGP